MYSSIRLLFLNNAIAFLEEIDTALDLVGLKSEGHQVEDTADFVEKLIDHKPNAIIIANGVSQDASSVQFRYDQVRLLLIEQKVFIPVWMLVQPADEAKAIKSMSEGLVDYFFTDRLSRLGPIAARLVGQDKPAFEPIDLNQIMADYLDEEKALPLNEELVFLPGADLPKVQGERGSLGQAVSSIFSGANEEMPVGTKTDVRTYLDAVKGEVCLEIKLNRAEGNIDDGIRG